MSKVFYSVNYMILGSNKPHRRWFDNLEEAKEFAKSDYCDNPERHIYCVGKTIEMIEQLIELEKD